MGNIISFCDNISDSLSMSNGLTDVLIDYLIISGSELAVSESEKRMIVFLAEKQQSVIGEGTVSFNITEMPWQIFSFETDKNFLLKVIDYARLLSFQKNIWDKLGYEPNRNLIDYALNGFEALIKLMTVNDIDEHNLHEWLFEREQNDPIYCNYPKCNKHGVMMSLFGCKLCNDGK